MKTTRYILAFVLAVWCAGNLYAITSSYYTAIDGKSGSDLRNALYEITKVGPANGHNYDKLWTAYKTTDVYPSDSTGKAGKIWDMYSNVLFTVSTNQCGNYSNVGDCYNREHSLPKSWFNEATPAYYDLGHIVPTDGKVNGQRSNYPFGECASGTRLTNGTKKGLGKLGTSTFTGYTSIGTVFEPDDIYKGDFARMYLYMVVRYKPGNTNNVNLAASGDGTKMFNSTDVNYGLTDYSVALLLKWHRQDPVSQKEIDRNNGMQTVQNNRNPFIDYPELVEYLWGNNAGQTVNLSGLTLSDGSVSSTYNVTLYRHGESEVLADKTGSFTLPTNELNACDNWVFDGWSTAEVTNTTTRPTTYVTTVNSARILWAVYAKTESSGSAPHRATMAESTVASVTFKASCDGSSEINSSIENEVSSSSGISGYSGTKVYAGADGIKLGSSKATGSVTITLSSAANVKSVIVSAKKYGSDTGTLSVKAGSTAVGSAQSPPESTGNLTFTAETAVANTTTITVSTSAKRAYIKSITVIAETSGGGSTTTTYYASEPEDCNCSGKLSTPAVTATPSDGTITLTWSDVTYATNGYTVTISKGTGYTTECGDVEIGEVTHSGTTNTCVITGLVNGLNYTASVVANATAAICESEAGTATATPVGCTAWDDPTFTYASYTLTAGGSATAAPTVGAGHGTRTFTSSDESVLTVASDGKVTPKSAGTATVTVHWAGADGYCPKDVTTSTFTVNGKVTVTFDKNDGSGTTTTQQVDYNTATVLTANTFTRTGYTFQGWATEASGAKVYNDGASITITAATTLYAVWQVNTHKVTFSPSPTGATVTVNSASTSPVNNVAYGSTVNIVVTPAAHYTIGSVTANGGVAVSGSGSNWSFTMPDKDVVITVTMVEDTKYTVNWYVSGTPTEEVKYAGEALAGIADPTIDCNDKVFVGWTSHSSYNSDEAPDDLFTSLSGLVMPSNNSTNYYAVFADEVTSGSGSAGWSETAITDLTSSDVFVIVGTNNSGAYAMTNDNGTSSAPAATSVTISDGKISSTVADNLKWNISGNATDGYTFYPNGSTSTWLYCTNTNNGVRVGTNDNKAFTISSGYLYNTATSRYVGIYNSSDWRCYTSSSTNIGGQSFAFYKYASGGTTTYTGYTTSCTAPTEVTVIFNANGGTGTMSDQVVSYNNATALTANAFTRTGYSFAGWATTADGSKTYDDQESVTLTKNTTLYALWTKNSYNVSFTPTMTGQATVTVNGSSTSPQSVEYEGTVSITITPDVAYTVSGVTVTGGVTPSGSGNNWSFTMPASDVTVTVTLAAKPTYTIRFLDNGNVISSQTVISGQAATPPSNPAGCEGYAFVGWWTETLASTNTTTHTWITSFTATGNQDYYAVFEHVAGDGGSSSTVSYSASAQSYGNASVPSNKTISGVTFAYAKGDGSNDPKYYDSGTSVRMYANNTLTISASSSISAITFTFGGTTSAGLTASVGTYSSGSWSGSASSITFTAGSSGQQYIQGISVTVGGGGTTYYTTISECCPNKPTLEFGVPTVNKYDGDDPFVNPITVTDNDLNVALKFSSSLPAKASVDPSTGQVTILDAMSDTPVTITATLDATKVGDVCQAKATASYTLNIYNKVTWSVNGVAHTEGDPTTQTTEGGTITAYPTDPDGSTVCGGKTFMGWTTAEYEESDTPPTPLYSGLSTMLGVYITQGTTFYAVFADEDSGDSGSGQSTTYEFTITSGDFTSGSYDANNGEHTSTATDVTDANNTISVTWTSNQVYSNAGMQWQKSKGYIYNNTDLGKINSVTVTSSEGSFTTYYGSTVQPNSSTSLGSDDGYFNIKTGSSATGKTSVVTVNFTTSSSGGGSVTTYSAYSTSCGLCMPKPEITSTIIKSDNATITWKAVTAATGYEFTCSGGTVKVTGTTATITGLTPLSDYTYSVRAQGGAPYTCFRTTNGSFSTPDCDDVPYDITATPYNVVQAIIRWKAEAERGKVIVYTNEACTSVFTTIADTISPCYVSGLAEDTRYWFKVFAGESQDCASPVQTFLTQTTAVEIVEWQNDGVIILLTGDETTASVLIEDKNDNATNVETNIANDLFFSKYYEASGNVKLWAVYNGTANKISLANVKVKVSSNGAKWGYVSGKENASATTSLASFGHKETGYIYPGEEIIVYNGGNTPTDASVIECMAGAYGSGYKTNPDSVWYEVKNNTTSFSGDDGLLLLNDNDTLDVIGGLDYAAAYDSASTYPGWGDGYGWNCDDGTDVAGKPMKLSTNRCILVRKNTVKDGTNAVAKNKTDFVTLCEEWWGSSVPKNDDSQAEIQSSCDNFSYVGHYDYQDYYASFEPVDTIETLTKNADGTITIPIPKLDTMSCTMLRINVYDKNTKEQKASREYRIPIMIQSGEVKSTNELFTKHGVAVCKDCDVLVFNGATLKKDNVGEDRDTIGNLTLYPGSTLELPSGKGDYHVKSLTYRVEGDNVPATKLNGDLYSETQQLIVTRRIKNDRYYFISFPYDVNVNEITLANGSKAVNGKDFRLLEYDAETRAQEGSLQGVPGHWKMLSGDKLHAGRGYAIAVNTKAMKEIMFPMTIPSKNLTNEERTKVTNTVDINEYIGAARNTNHNWNLIAHPYITKFEVTSGATPGTTNVEAYWEHPSRRDSAWVDDWETWEDPTQPTDSTETHTGEIVESGTTEGGIVWVLYADGSIELTGAGQMSDFTSLDAVPWAQHRQLIQNVKIGGDVQKIGKYAFGQCTNLTNVIIAAPVTNLASQAFAGCTGLRTFRIESAQYVSATTTTFDGISSLTMISLYVPQSMYSQYSAQTPWSKMAISAFDDNSTTGGQTSGDGTNTTNPSPRRAPVHDGWTESPGGIYVTIPVVKDGKVGYDQYWINEVTDIKPFTAVFIQGDGQGEMTFNMYPSSPAPKRMLQAAPCETRDHTVFVGLTINGNGQKDKTSLRLRPDFTEEYKFNLDLLKFTVFNTARPQIYFKTPDDQLAFRAISDSLAEHTWIPVGVYCRDAGTYTFSLYDKYVLDEIEAVYLHDNVTGVTTNLLYGNYTIETTKQLYTNTRFTLNVILRRKVEVDTPTMIDHTENPNAPRKFFRDGVMYIMRDGKIYDLTGKPAELDKLMLNL